MADEFDTLAEAGTDTVDPSQDDTAPDWDYYDPDEDQDTVEDPEQEATEDEAGEPEDTPEEEPEEEPGQSDDEPTVADETAVVRLADGTETTVAELSKSYLRQADYTRKSTEVAERRKAVSADAERATKITEALVDRLSQLIPDPPDASLAYSDPNRFTAMRAQHEAAVAEIQKIVSLADEAKGLQHQMSQQDRDARRNEENMKLAERFPETGTREGREKFFEAAAEAAMGLGFSEQEIQIEMDHRMFALAHYAKIGMEAEKAKTTAKSKVAKAAPTPRQKPGQGARPVNKNREAMKRLAQSGSIRDALAVDWD